MEGLIEGRLEGEEKKFLIPLSFDKLNGIYKVNGTDMLAGVNSLI